jgi:thymidylate synthase (FAD)
MNVKLVSYSQPTEEFASQGIDNAQELIAYCARVSNPTNQFNSETSEKLIKYLIKHAHWSPLEMVSATLEIDTTRDIAHQIVRHRSFSFQEFSQRYANPAEMGDQFVLREARLQDNKNRQNSVEIDINTDDGRRLAWMWEEQQKKVIETARNAYNWAIDNGIAKEQARCVLPEGLTKTRLYMNGTLRSWVHYIELRAANGTQKEHMEIARACASVIAQIFPIATELVAKD